MARRPRPVQGIGCADVRARNRGRRDASRPPRSAAIVQAFGLSGRLDLQQHRIRATLAGVEGRYERREAFRQAFPGLREASDRIIDGRIRRALK